MLFPPVSVIDLQREVIASSLGVDFFGSVTNEMQRLGGSQLEPCAWKIKSGTWQFGKKQSFLVEVRAGDDIGNMDCDVVQLFDLHDDRLLGEHCT